MRRLNAESIQLIRTFEGLRLHTYSCSAGKLTIGFGHTGPDVIPGMVIDATQAARLLEADLQRFSEGVEMLIETELNDNQFGALCSFAFNVGLRNLKNSTLRHYLNQGKFKLAAEEFLKWTLVNGKPSRGILNRREAERLLFLKPA